MINVIHIKSYGHSGSTLANLFLARNKGVFAGGHLFRYKRLWQKEDNLTTNDGTLIKDSAFWNKVKSYLADNGLRVDAEGAVEDIAYDDIKNLFQAILECSDCPVICDNSKAKDFDSIIYNETDFKTLMVHVVRDGRAVYHSMHKKNKNTLFMPFHWTVSNLIIWLKYRKKNNYILLPYERLVSDPEGVMSEVLSKSAQFFDVDIQALKSKGCDSIPLMFAGNRMRLNYDGNIKYDDAYLQKISFFKWWYLTLVMFPTIWLFSYKFKK
jgi:hypothetical protein